MYIVTPTIFELHDILLIIFILLLQFINNFFFLQFVSDLLSTLSPTYTVQFISDFFLQFVSDLLSTLSATYTVRFISNFFHNLLAISFYNLLVIY